MRKFIAALLLGAVLLECSSGDNTPGTCGKKIECHKKGPWKHCADGSYKKTCSP